MEKPEPTENDKNFPFDALLNLLEVPYEQIQRTKARLSSGDALRYRNLGTKAYIKLCSAFHVKPCKDSLPDPEKLKSSIKFHQDVLKQLRRDLKKYG